MKHGYYDLLLAIAPGSLVTSLNDGEKWVVVDAWTQSGRDFTAGKFGFLIPGSDRVGLANFRFDPK